MVSMRVLQGAAAAMMYPQALTGIQLLFTGAGRARAIGMFAMALAAGAVVGQILGGVLVSADIAGLGWRSIFLVNVPLCLAMIVAAVRFVPPGNPRKTGRPDLAGVVTLTISVLLLVAPLTLGRDQGWPPWTWISLAAFPFACWLFLRTQYHATRHGRAPLVAVDLVRRDPIALALLALLIATGTYYALLFTAAQYFQHGLGRSALASGLLLLPWVAAFGLAGQVVRWVPARPRSVLPSIGYLVLVVVYVAIAVAMLTGPVGDPALLVLFGLGGLGLGIGFAALIRHLTEQVPAAYGADISEVATTTLQLGGAIGIAMFGSVYLVFADATDARHAFGTTNAALAVAAIIATMAAYIATRSRRVATVS
jgi:predicted MFS family arabinose efflux permease